MKSVLFIGENPLGTTGCSHMMASLLNQVDYSQFHITCFSIGDGLEIPTEKAKYITVPAPRQQDDPWAVQPLFKLLQQHTFDIICFIGLDIWRYAQFFNPLNQIRQRTKCKILALFPYDLPYIREDWVKWIKFFDVPLVYSKFGENILKPHIPIIQYFRPPLHRSDIFKPYDKEKRLQIRRTVFRAIHDDTFVFGFVGQNQLRKEPQKLVHAFANVKKRIIHDNDMQVFGENQKSVGLYLHTELDKGFFNLRQAIIDYGFSDGDIYSKPHDIVLEHKKMPDIYNMIDCLVNCSMQEGLSFTPLEAMLCGTPVIATDTTAQTEIVKEAGVLVPCKMDSFLSLITTNGESWVDTKTCNVADIEHAMLSMLKDEERRQAAIKLGFKRADEWLDGVSDINNTLNDVLSDKHITSIKRKPEVLFAQHSSAGDVLMSTQCFKGIKERHRNKKLVYMTQKQFQGVVKDNPYIDEIIDWDDSKILEYSIVYNPHGEKILPGGFNNGDVPLYAMYPYFCKVKADDIFIVCDKPKIALPDKYIVVHTTGGQKEYRTYTHMDMVVKPLNYSIVQLGGSGDLVCHEADLDLRGKLTFTESAYVMKRAIGAIVIDSFLSHLAGAVGTPVVILYGPAPARVVGPLGDADRIINIQPNKLDACPILTSCWGQPGKHQCIRPCIETINPSTIRKALLNLIKEN